MDKNVSKRSSKVGYKVYMYTAVVIELAQFMYACLCLRLFACTCTVYVARVKISTSKKWITNLAIWTRWASSQLETIDNVAALLINQHLTNALTTARHSTPLKMFVRPTSPTLVFLVEFLWTDGQRTTAHTQRSIRRQQLNAHVLCSLLYIFACLTSHAVFRIHYHIPAFSVRVASRT